MPNHVTNLVHVTGDEKVILRMLEEIRQEEAGIGSVDFNRIIPRPESLEIRCGLSTSRCMELYLACVDPGASWHPGQKMDPEGFENLMGSLKRHGYGRMAHPSPERLAETERKLLETGEFTDRKEMESLGREAVRNVLQYGSATCIDWCLIHWGTKQNSYGYEAISPEEAKGGKLVFYTANSCADKVIRKLSGQYPELFFSYRWADEDFGNHVGEKEYEAGEEVFCNIPPRGSNEAFAMAEDILGLSPEECGYQMDAKLGIYVYQ